MAKTIIISGSDNAALMAAKLLAQIPDEEIIIVTPEESIDRGITIGPAIPFHASERMILAAMPDQIKMSGQEQRRERRKKQRKNKL